MAKVTVQDINELRQMNYSAYESEQFWAYNENVKSMIA